MMIILAADWLEIIAGLFSNPLIDLHNDLAL